MQSPEPPGDFVEVVIRLIIIAALMWLLGVGVLGCQTHREPYPWNSPKAWEYNKHFEGFQSVYDAYKSLRAPKGMLWDPLMQSYQQNLRPLDVGFKLPTATRP